MSIVVLKAVTFRHIYQIDRSNQLVRLRHPLSWPVNSLWTQRSYQPSHIQQIPAVTTFCPCPLIRIMKITPQGVTDKLVVKPRTVISQDGCIRCCNLL